MIKVFFWIIFLPIRIFQTILAYYFTWRGYKYIKDKNGFYYWK
jgi:hypothetical protein